MARRPRQSTADEQRQYARRLLSDVSRNLESAINIGYGAGLSAVEISDIIQAATQNAIRTGTQPPPPPPQEPLPF